MIQSLMGICMIPFLQVTVLLLWIQHIQEFQCFHLVMMIVFASLVPHGAEIGSSRAPHSV